MDDTFRFSVKKEVDSLYKAGLFKNERIITSLQGSEIQTIEGKSVLNFCANNYLGLCYHPRILSAIKSTLETHGYGLSSVRFICGTQDIHKTLENKIADFVYMEDAILYAAAFDANGGLFEPLFGANDAIISDALNHASIIDGIRLSKAARYRYKHNDMKDLERCLDEAKQKGSRRKAIVTDGVFSMDGTIAQLNKICDLADRYEALTIVDDSHASGVIGRKGRGTPEYHGVIHRVDIITSTLGKALGGTSGGFTAGKKEIIEILRQRSRPYLFSNTLPPCIVGGAIEVFRILEKNTFLQEELQENTDYFRARMTAYGFDIPPGDHPIVPIMLYEAKIAQEFASRLLDEGVYVVGFFYPVVPQGKARIRVQISAAHNREQLDRAIDAFVEVGKKMNVIKTKEV